MARNLQKLNATHTINAVELADVSTKRAQY